MNEKAELLVGLEIPALLPIQALLLPGDWKKSDSEAAGSWINLFSFL